jgi:hypothetical protein
MQDKHQKCRARAGNIDFIVSYSRRRLLQTTLWESLSKPSLATKFSQIGCKKFVCCQNERLDIIRQPFKTLP